MEKTMGKPSKAGGFRWRFSLRPFVVFLRPAKTVARVDTESRWGGIWGDDGHFFIGFTRHVSAMWYPLVNSHITMERSTIFNGKSTISTGSFSIAMLVYRRVFMTLEQHPFLDIFVDIVAKDDDFFLKNQWPVLIFEIQAIRWLPGSPLELPKPGSLPQAGGISLETACQAWSGTFFSSTEHPGHIHISFK